VTTLLDEMGATPIAALKSGGVGLRERARVAKRLLIANDVLVLWIDWRTPLACWAASTTVMRPPTNSALNGTVTRTWTRTRDRRCLARRRSDGHIGVSRVRVPVLR
jgi:hypothetical protein